MGKPKKTRNPGVGVDFKRVKHKVGKKLPKARNETDTDFKSRSINLPSQGVREDRSGVAVNYQNLTLKELLNQTSHHNDKSRKHSLAGLADLFGRHPEQLRLHAAQVLGTLAERVVDGDSGVRTALRGLLHESVLPLLGADLLRPFMPVVMAHVCGAMTHLSLDVRNDALLFLDVMMDHAPQLVADGYLAACLSHFCDLFSAAHRGRTIRSQSLAALTKLLTALTVFLRRAFPDDDASPATAAAGRSDTAGDGADGRNAAAAAGPGPSSLRQQQQEQQRMRKDTASGAAEAATAAAVTLGADRARWPARPAAELLRLLDEQFRTVAAVTHAGGKARRGSAAPAAALDPKGKGKKGRGSVSTSETATQSHMVGGAGPTGGKKAVEAAAAALAAVTAPVAAAAAGMDLAAPSGFAAAGVLGSATTMSAALAAASDARASALRLVSLLMDCWLECTPAQLATSPELEQATALAMIATACNTLVQRLLLPPLEPDAAAPGGGGRGSGSHSLAATASSREARERLLLTQQVHDVVARRVATHFPVTMPPVKPSAAVADALVRLNLRTAELLCCFLPLVRGLPQANGGSGGAAALPWIPFLVSYYIDVLEHGVLVPAAAGTLSDAKVTAAAAVGLPTGVSDAVLAAVSTAVEELQDDAATAQRLMGAVSEFAARQPPRSAARLACIRMQHGLLKAALAGRLFLDEGVVATWLVPLPKLLWEAGGAAPAVSRAALILLLDVARFAAPGSSMSAHLASTLQPQLAPLLATQLPPKAAQVALARHRSATAAARGVTGPASAAPGDSESVLVVLPGVVHKLPESVAALLVDLLYHTGPLGAPLLKPLAAALSCAALPPSLTLRLLDVVLARLRDGADPTLAASWLLTLFFGPQHGQLVLSPEGIDLSAPWERQRDLVTAAARGMGGLGGAGPLLRVLAPQLAALPLTEAASASKRGARLQRFSFVQLCTFARAEAGRGGGVPPELVAFLPAAAALCGLELGAAAAGSCGGGAAPAAVYGPVVQLLEEDPSLVTSVLLSLAGMLQGGRGDGSVAAATGSLPVHTAALAALRLAQAAIKLPGVRAVLAPEEGPREAVVDAAGALAAAARALPVSTGDAGMGHAAECGVESQRLQQTVADLYGGSGSAGAKNDA